MTIAVSIVNMMSVAPRSADLGLAGVRLLVNTQSIKIVW